MTPGRQHPDRAALVRAARLMTRAPGAAASTAPLAALARYPFVTLPAGF